MATIDDDGWRLTPKQFRERIVRECMKEFGATHARASEVHPERCTDRRHFDSIWRAAAAGETIPPMVLDRITSGRRDKLWHDWPGCIPDGYLDPEGRKRQRELSRARHA